MVAGGVRFVGGVRSFVVDVGGVCMCVVSWVVYAARWLGRCPSFSPPWFGQGFLAFPPPS